MKHFVWILGIYLGLTACRSSYDEGQRKPEIKSTGTGAVSTPIVDTPKLSGSDNGSGFNFQRHSEVNPLPDADPSSIMTQHDASPEELKKYNCKGTALITDSGMDRNKDGILQDEEIQETRIDCTEVVPASNP